MGACKFLAAPEICSGRPEQSRRFPRAENRTIHPKLSFPEIVFKLFPFREQDNPPKILFSRTENRTIHPKFSRNSFQIISFSQLGRKHVMWAALIVMLILIVIHSKKKGGDTNTTDKIETQLQITKILFEIPDGQPLSWGHRQPLPTGANSSPASPVKLVLKNALLGVVDLDGLGWIWMDLNGLGWTWNPSLEFKRSCIQDSASFPQTSSSVRLPPLTWGDHSLCSCKDMQICRYEDVWKLGGLVWEYNRIVLI